MVNRAKNKGTSYESLIAAYQREFFPFVDRLPLKGNKDVGDLTPIHDGVQELKAGKRMDLAGWMAEAQAEAVNLGTSRYWVIHKRRGVAVPARQWVTTELSVFMNILKDIG